jgi:hypothetical protein
VVVDTPSATNATFGMQFDCQPYCNDAYDFDCSATRSVPAGTSNDGTGSSSLTAKWGPTAGAGCGGLTNLAGSEYVIGFTTPNITSTRTFRFELAAQTPGKELSMIILDGGTGATPTCAPTLPCANVTPSTTDNGTGNYTTNAGKIVTLDLTTSSANHHYWVVVDAQAGVSSTFALTVAGTTSGALCP